MLFQTPTGKRAAPIEGSGGATEGALPGEDKLHQGAQVEQLRSKNHSYVTREAERKTQTGDLGLSKG